MGRAARPLHDAGNHHSIARGSDLQAACRGSLRHRLNPPESAKSTPLLHHCAGHDHREFVKGPWSDPESVISGYPRTASEEDVEFARQRFVVKGTDRSVGLFEAAATALEGDLPADLRGPLMGVSDQVMSIPSFAYTCAVPEV